MPNQLISNAKLGFGIAVGFVLLGVALMILQFILAKARG